MQLYASANVLLFSVSQTTMVIDTYTNKNAQTHTHTHNIHEYEPIISSTLRLRKMFYGPMYLAGDNNSTNNHKRKCR